MAVTRSMTRKQDHDSCSGKRSKTRKQNQDACSRKRSKTRNGGSASWSDLCHDMLFLLMLKLGIVDFISFSGVCKAWRSVALSNRNMFMATRRPMAISLSSGSNRKECYLEDQEGRMFKTVLPNSSHRTCVGLTCGYLILFGRITHDFILVNPITRHEIHFPRFPFPLEITLSRVRAILVFSPSMSEWVFMFTLRSSKLVSFASSCKKSSWTHIMTGLPMYDLRAFQGKIYGISTFFRLCEVKLNVKPTVKLVEIKSPHKCSFLVPQLVSRGERLYVADWFSESILGCVGVDFDEMKWVKPEKTTYESYFLNKLKKGKKESVIDLVIWDEPHTFYKKFVNFNDSGKGENDEGKHFFADMWYVPHDCLTVNHLDE